MTLLAIAAQHRVHPPSLRRIQLRQTLTHLLTCSLSALPVAYLMYWMPHNVRGILLYFGIFLGIYVSIWASQFFAARARVRELNEKLHKKE